jgi:hypothetical protein
VSEWSIIESPDYETFVSRFILLRAACFSSCNKDIQSPQQANGKVLAGVWICVPCLVACWHMTPMIIGQETATYGHLHKQPLKGFI